MCFRCSDEDDILVWSSLLMLLMNVVLVGGGV